MSVPGESKVIFGLKMYFFDMLRDLSPSREGGRLFYIFHTALLCTALGNLFLAPFHIKSTSQQKTALFMLQKKGKNACLIFYSPAKCLNDWRFTDLTSSILITLMQVFGSCLIADEERRQQIIVRCWSATSSQEYFSILASTQQNSAIINLYTNLLFTDQKWS